MLSRGLASVVLVVGLLPFLGTTANAQPSFRTVAVTGEQAPGLAAGTTFIGFSRMSISAGGDAAFLGMIEGPGVLNGAFGNGVWHEPAGGPLAFVAQQRGLVPIIGGTAQIESFGVYPPVHNAQGDVLFFATLRQGGGIGFGNARGLWRTAPGSFTTLVVREGDATTGVDDETTFSFMESTPLLNASGQSAFTALTRNPGGSGGGMWRAEPNGGLVPLVTTGTAVPGESAGVAFALPKYVNHTPINAAGDVLFVGSIAGVGIDSTNNLGIWAVGADGSIDEIAREGDPAPGIAGVFGDFGAPTHNTAGDVVGLCVLTGAGVSSENDTGIWVLRDDRAPAPIALEGDQVPGLPGGLVFAEFNSPRLNELGCIVFRARVAGPGVDESNEWGVWSVQPNGAAAILVRSSDAAPGFPAGAWFDTVGTPVLGASGAIVFTGTVAGPGVAPDTRGVWMSRGRGSPALLVREGTQIQSIGPDGSVRAFDVTDVTFLAQVDQDGGPRSVSAQDEVLVGLGFGSFPSLDNGVFVISSEPCNPADLNADGVLNVDDIEAFVTAFLSADLAADCDANTVLNVDDIECFVAAFLAGCG
ncbi:MAG: hypothetical protein DHS20C14_19790 [Phycisphaeraceae bacterium]|nr:MAG: hypothetical protein DHS20C14_19790 [Phycisphaeraceae bacterium]